MSETHDQTCEFIDVNLRALSLLKERLEGCLEQAVNETAKRLDAGHKVIVTGLGKNFHIGHKIAATLTSTGAPAFMLHPAEAMHGDLGMIGPHDVIIALSYSGETEELLTMLPHACGEQNFLISITGEPQSRLARKSQVILPITIDREACPFNLAPTTSSLLTLVAGDLFAMLLHQTRHFSQEAYARLHPGGSIGQTLSLRAKDIMRSGERLPRAVLTTTVHEAVLCMTTTRSGAVGIVDENEQLLGVFTDGDFRRLATSDAEYAQRSMQEVMVPQPKNLNESCSVPEIMQLFQQHNINCVLITNDQGAYTGLVDLQDMPKLKLL